MSKKKRRITLADVAREAGVSPMTVSRVVNDTGRISDETRQHVRAIIARLGYRPSRIARSLVTNQTLTVGLVVPDITNPYFAEIVRGAENVIWQEDYNVLLANTDENPAREEAVLARLEETTVDGVILCSSRLADEHLTDLVAKQRAAVVINRRVPRELASAVLPDPRAENRNIRAARHLIQSGRRCIGYLHLIRSTVSPKVNEFAAIIRAAGVASNTAWYRGCLPTWESGYENARILLESHPELDAIVSGNDLVALGALRAAQELGRHIPADLALTGADDILMAREATPPLTTFRIPKYTIGATAAALLFKRIAGSRAYEEFFYNEELIIRESAP